MQHNERLPHDDQHESPATILVVTFKDSVTAFQGVEFCGGVFGERR
jgi:hypothetical protein